MRRLLRFVVTVLGTCCLSLAVDKAREETRATEAIRKFGVSGRGVAIAILDRGIDWQNNDFRNADGSTRIDSIFDMTDNAGAAASGNPFRTGTIYSRAQIDAALRDGTPLAHRDAVGHGTTTAGIAAGNGRNSRSWKYRGYAPKSSLVVVKLVAGAAAHDDQPAEANFVTSATTIPNAIQYALGRAKELGVPMVMLPNIGSVGGPMDGTSTQAKLIDSNFGPGIAGLVFVTGSSDDGGRANHAQSTMAQGQTVSLQIEKQDARFLRLELWYPESDRYEVTIQAPNGTQGPFTPPATNAAADSRTAAGIAYFHYGSAATPYGATSRRLILTDLTGAAGRYVVTVRGATASGGTFHAWLNTVAGEGEFRNLVTPGYTVWDLASARNNICPNDYVLREKWADVDGLVRSIRDDRVGDLWAGSGIGPTLDGRLGIDISAPGNSLFATLAPKSVYGVSRANRVQDGAGLYTLQNAVSAANPQVTGIIALMLELNPKLDAAQVKRILQQTARRDQYTGAEPNTRWGHGKIDALAALTAASELPGARAYYTVDRNEIAVDHVRGGETPLPFTVQVSPGNGAGDFQVAASPVWIRAARSEDGTSVSIEVDVAGLNLGDYSGEVTITSTDGKAVPQTIMVHLQVRSQAPLITSVTDAAAGGPGFANGSRIVIRGFDLASTTQELSEADLDGDKLPVTLAGVRVRVFDRDGYPYFVSPTEVRLIAPDNPLSNTRFALTVVNNGRASNSYVANTLPRNPEFFRLKGTRYVEARFRADGVVAAPEGVLADGAASRLVLPGEEILLFGTGCGATDPVVPADRMTKDAMAAVTDPVVLTIGGKPAVVAFAGAVGNGVCRVDATVPELPAGDAEVILRIGNFLSADAVLLAVGGN